MIETERKDSDGTLALIKSKLVVRNMPSTAEELCAEYGIHPSELVPFCEQIITQILNFCEENKSSGYAVEDTREHFDFIFRCYQLSKNTVNAAVLGKLPQNLKSFEKFMGIYGHNMSTHARQSFINRFKLFYSAVIAPKKEKFIDKTAPIEHFGQYGVRGTWIPINENFSEIQVVDESIFTEIIQLGGIAHNQNDIYHATGSAALAGIGNSRAILSARKALSSGVQILTGEFSSYGGEINPQASGGKTGDRIIYAEADISTVYSVVRWFDEHAVSFGISIDKLKQYRTEFLGKQKIVTNRKWDSEVTLGDEVPLDCINTIYTEFINVPRVREWASIYCPSATVISFEAESVIRSVTENLQANNVSPEVNWSNFLKTSSVKL